MLQRVTQIFQVGVPKCDLVHAEGVCQNYYYNVAVKTQNFASLQPGG